MEEVYIAMDELYHIVTVGTSIISNALRQAGQGNPLFKPYTQELTDLLVGRSTRIPGGLHDNLVSYTVTSPREASAELNAFLGLLETMEAPAGHALTLYTTDTPASRIAADILSTALKERPLPQRHTLLELNVKTIDHLGRDFWHGLTSLLATLIEDILKAKKRNVKVYVNPTGGYKPETGYTLIAASLAGADAAYYIHENLRKTIILPLYKLRPSPETCTLLQTLTKRPPPTLARQTEQYGLTIQGIPTQHARKLATLLQRFC